MWNKTLTLTEFVEAFGAWERNHAANIAVESNNFLFKEGENLTLAWFAPDYSPFELPHAIVVPENRIDAFLGFAATYLTATSPISSVIRIIDNSTFERLLPYRSLDVQTAKILSSIVIAEVIGEVRSRSRFESLSITAFTSAYSYSMAKCFAITGDKILWQRTSKSWFAVRNLTNQPKRKTDVENLVYFWNLVWQVLEETADFSTCSTEEIGLITFLRIMKNKNQIDRLLWSTVFGSIAPFEVIELLKEAPREDKFELLQRIFERLQSKPKKGPLEDFAIGFLVSLISVNTFEHAEMLFPMLDRYPTAINWYGLCIALAEKATIDTWKIGLDRRLRRELSRSLNLGERPNTDISFDEFIVLNRASTPFQTVIQASSKTLTVELIPGVEQLISWPNRNVEYQPEYVNHTLVIENTKKDIDALVEKCLAIRRNLDTGTSAVKETEVAIIDYGSTLSIPVNNLAKPNSTGKKKSPSKQKKRGKGR